jgi:hypothetical protein
MNNDKARDVEAVFVVCFGLFVVLFYLFYVRSTEGGGWIERRIRPEDKRYYSARQQSYYDQRDKESAQENNTTLVYSRGGWSYECLQDYGLNRLSWFSYVELGGRILKIRLSFDDNTVLARLWEKTSFKVYLQEDPAHWFSIYPTGRFDPDTLSFRSSETASTYPGGYNKLETDLRSLGIDWEELHQSLQEDFLGIYSNLDLDACKPPLLIPYDLYKHL